VVSKKKGVNTRCPRCVAKLRTERMVFKKECTRLRASLKRKEILIAKLEKKLSK